MSKNATGYLNVVRSPANAETFLLPTRFVGRNTRDMRTWFKHFLQIFLLSLIAIVIVRPSLIPHMLERGIASFTLSDPLMPLRLALLVLIRGLYYSTYAVLTHYSFLLLGNFSLSTTFKSDFRIGCVLLTLSLGWFFGSSYFESAWMLTGPLILGVAYAYYCQRRGLLFKRWFVVFNYLLAVVYMYFFSLGAMLIFAKAVGHSLKLSQLFRF